MMFGYSSSYDVHDNEDKSVDGRTILNNSDYEEYIGNYLFIPYK